LTLACLGIPTFTYVPTDPVETSCHGSTQLYDGSGLAYGAPIVSAPTTADTCCTFFIFGITTDVAVRDACATTYSNYAY
jgi:hypothetical protein